MERLYCSRCLKAHRDTTLEECPRRGCSTPRPEEGWPEYLEGDAVIDGRFRVLKMVGSGGAGLTYQCLDLQREEFVAVKVLHSDRRDGMLGQRMALEGQLLELLKHPGVVPFRGIKVVGPGPTWLATSYVPGGTLADQVRRSGPLPLTAVASLAVQLAEALAYVHRRGVVHRDIKPSNLLLESNDPARLKVQVADFGIARLFGAGGTPLGINFTQTGLFVGTPEFAAPEQMRGERDIGPGVDKYALGAVLHFAATGESLFKCSSPADWIRRRDSVWLPSQRPRLAAGVFAAERELALTLDRLIDGLMAREPQERLSLGVLRESLAAHVPTSFGPGIEISTTLCEAPEPREMQMVARLGSQTEDLPTVPSIAPVVAVTRVEATLSELLSDSWTTGLENPDEVHLDVSPGRTLGQGSQHRPLETSSVDVEVQWLPRATRRRRGLLRVLAAVLVLSLGLEAQTLRSEGRLSSVETVLAEASSWLQSAVGVPNLRGLQHNEEGPASRILASAPLPALETSEEPSVISAKIKTTPTKRTPSPVVAAARRPEGRRVSPPSRGEVVRLPQEQKREMAAPRIVVGSDDVWGVKSRRGRAVGDALAYDAEDAEVLERLFGEY